MIDGLNEKGLNEFERLRKHLPHYVEQVYFSRDKLFKELQEKAIKDGTDQALILLLAECSYVVGYLDGLRTSVKGLS